MNLVSQPNDRLENFFEIALSTLSRSYNQIESDWQFSFLLTKGLPDSSLPTIPNNSVTNFPAHRESESSHIFIVPLSFDHQRVVRRDEIAAVDLVEFVLNQQADSFRVSVVLL